MAVKCRDASSARRCGEAQAVSAIEPATNAIGVLDWSASIAPCSRQETETLDEDALHELASEITERPVPAEPMVQVQ